jgi:hypothetical protein
LLFGGRGTKGKHYPYKKKTNLNLLITECDNEDDDDNNKNTVKRVLNGISRVQNIFPLKTGFRLVKVCYDSHGI